MVSRLPVNDIVIVRMAQWLSDVTILPAAIGRGSALTVHNKLISGSQALRQAGVPMVLKTAIGKYVQISKSIHYSLCHQGPVAIEVRIPGGVDCARSCRGRLEITVPDPAGGDRRSLYPTRQGVRGDHCTLPCRGRQEITVPDSAGGDRKSLYPTLQEATGDHCTRLCRGRQEITVPDSAGGDRRSLYPTLQEATGDHCTRPCRRRQEITAANLNVNSYSK
ncbi:hypothetical protein PoB_006265700 [Plakobranchus ocellatus]|uniref:Uncharacterized protein n=1 Tax=Plakobranchus ocellatus TaxID=259542 RepID=A0AAV4CW66_9GAST|nr:hypothetical protein PoB_006265700 [Plakobranchus ocellatus]